MDNPFTLAFGRKPHQYISRIAQTEKLIEKMNSSNPPSQAYIITGVRGSGKTVMMTTVADRMREYNDWVVVELNPGRDMLQSLIAKLCAEQNLKKLFVNAKLNLSVFGIDIFLEESEKIYDIEVAVSKILQVLQDDGKKVLITIDEAVKSKEMKLFASSFQIFIRENHPLFLLMTGLYENINNLQNDKSLTFLYRAPKIYLEPLNYTAIRKSYQSIFNITTEEASDMATVTMGYSFAYQALGYIRWENKSKSLDEILDEFDRYLDEFVYGKIWMELPESEQSIIIDISENGTSTVKELREHLDMNSQKFSVYRDRLKKKSIISTNDRGEVKLALPRFDIYVKNRLI